MSELPDRKAFIVALLALALALAGGLPQAASAQQQECLTNLYQCHVCVQKTGSIDISGCQDQPPSNAAGIPPEELVPPATADLSGIHKVVADRILAHWDVLNSVFGDKNRIYIPREVYDLAGRYPGATAEETLRAAVIRFQRYLIGRAAQARVVSVPTGDGGQQISIQAADALVSFVLRLLNDAGAFADVDLKALMVPGERGLAPNIELPSDPLFELFQGSLEIRE